jgi:formate/nitrite transporter FocA (FNT family)
MHENHHLIVKVATKLQGMVHAIEQTNEELQVSDKISFAAGFGCGLLVCLAIWIAPFGGGKDKDDDAEK